MKTVLVGEAKPILDELVRKAAMGQEIRISTGGFVARLVAGTEARSTGKEMVARVRKWGGKTLTGPPVSHR